MTDDHPEGEDIGRMDTPALAALVVEAVNAELRMRDLGTSMGSVDRGGAPYPQLASVYRDAEALLAGRNAGHPHRLAQELRRMRDDLDEALRAVGEGERWLSCPAGSPAIMCASPI